MCRLIQAFGSQRRKKQLHNAQAGRVDASQLTSGDAMLHLIRSTKADPGVRADVIKESLSHRNIPPHNSKATKPDEAYPFDEIVPKIVRDSLDTSLLEKACQDNGVLSEISKVLGPYVASRVAGSSLFKAASCSENTEGLDLICASTICCDVLLLMSFSAKPTLRSAIFSLAAL